MYISTDAIIFIYMENCSKVHSLYLQSFLHYVHFLQEYAGETS